VSLTDKERPFTGAYKIAGINPVTKKDEELIRSPLKASRTSRGSTLPSQCPGNTGQLAQSDEKGKILKKLIVDDQDTVLSLLKRQITPVKIPTN